MSGPRLTACTRMQMSSGDAFRVFDEDIEVAMLVEAARVNQFVLWLEAATTSILFD